MQAEFAARRSSTRATQFVAPQPCVTVHFYAEPPPRTGESCLGPSAAQTQGSCGGEEREGFDLREPLRFDAAAASASENWSTS